ncbi:hypothetical protein ACEYW6_29945 [Nostoc sp. UIC 10607]|uniref:hypothetical protein n=1 Tax=Nostoc sp. UIC 10607 TaxID=3045935 RepID=UPI00399F7B68
MIDIFNNFVKNVPQVSFKAFFVGLGIGFISLVFGDEENSVYSHTIGSLLFGVYISFYLTYFVLKKLSQGRYIVKNCSYRILQISIFILITMLIELLVYFKLAHFSYYPKDKAIYFAELINNFLNKPLEPNYILGFMLYYAFICFIVSTCGATLYQILKEKISIFHEE